MKPLTLVAIGILAVSVLMNAVATLVLDRAQPWLTISFGLLVLVQPLLILSLILWVVRRGRTADAGR